MNIGRSGRQLTFLLALVCSSAPASATEKLSLTVVVSGVTSESDEAIAISNATVSVKTTDGTLERPTKANGKANFLVPAGTIPIIVTGQDTVMHWATGTCIVELATQLVVNIQLDLDEPTQCERETIGDDAASRDLDDNKHAGDSGEPTEEDSTDTENSSEPEIQAN